MRKFLVKRNYSSYYTSLIGMTEEQVLILVNTYPGDRFDITELIPRKIKTTMEIV